MVDGDGMLQRKCGFLEPRDAGLCRTPTAGQKGAGGTEYELHLFHRSRSPAIGNMQNRRGRTMDGTPS